MRILYLHQFFITRAGVGGTRSYEFARRFVERGHAVRMVTAAEAEAAHRSPPGACRAARSRSVNGIEVVGVRGAYAEYMPATAMSNARRILAFARFAAGATLEAVRGPRPDVIYATSPPLTMALPALAARLRWRAPLVFEVRDLWPEAPIQMGALRNPLAQRLARAVERFVYAHSVRVVALSPGIRSTLPPDRSVLIPNGADLDLFTPAPPPARFRVSYFGALGEANDVTAAIEAARRLPEVSFVIMGDGKRRAELERAAPENVEFRTGTKEDVARLAAESSVCLTLFKDVPVLATNSPNKLFDTFAAGRPAVVNMDGWMRELVEHNEAGVYVHPGDAAELAEKLAWLRDNPDVAERMGRNARALAERDFGRDELAARALTVLEEAAR